MEETTEEINDPENQSAKVLHSKLSSSTISESSDAKHIEDTFLPWLDQDAESPQNLSVTVIEKCIDIIKESNKSLEFENDLMESFLRSMEPQLIEDMDSVLLEATEAALRAERSKELIRSRSSVSSFKSEKTDEMSSESQKNSIEKITPTLNGRGPEVQPYFKIDIIRKETFNVQLNYEQKSREYEKEIFKQKCLKESRINRIAQINADLETLNIGLKTEWKNPVTQQIPGETVVAYFDKKLRLEDLQLKNLISRVKNLTIQHDALTQKLKQMGRELTYVDFELLQIELSKTQDELDSTYARLTALKKVNTKNLSALSRTFQVISGQQGEIKKVSKEINYLEKDIHHYGKSEMILLHNIRLVRDRMEKLQMLDKEFETAPLMDYIRHQYELNKLKNAFKSLKNKACYRKMMKSGKENNKNDPEDFEKKVPRGKMWTKNNFLPLN